jgi:hypothetical protein
MTTTGERQPRPSRRQVLRVEAQDGPWTVSVAENHHRPSSYTLYVKSEYPFIKELSKLLVCCVALSCCVVTFSFSSRGMGLSEVPFLRFRLGLCPYLPNLDFGG